MTGVAACLEISTKDTRKIFPGTLTVKELKKAAATNCQNYNRKSIVLFFNRKECI